MSDFCFDDEACHVNETIGEGPLDVVRVWRIVKVGWSAVMRIDPFLYLLLFSRAPYLEVHDSTHPIA